MDETRVQKTSLVVGGGGPLANLGQFLAAAETEIWVDEEM